MRLCSSGTAALADRHATPEPVPLHVTVLTALVTYSALVAHALGEFDGSVIAPLGKEDVGVHATTRSTLDPLPLPVIREKGFQI